MADFNPNSTDAMFAKILTELQDIKTTVVEVRTQAQLTNGRVTSLEKDRWYQRGIVAAIGVGATGAWEFIKSR